MGEDKKFIVVDCSGPSSETFEDFTGKLPEDRPRYAICDIDYDTEDGRKQNKLCFFFWSPDDKTSVKDRMLYASSKDAIKKKLYITSQLVLQSQVTRLTPDTPN